MGSENRKCVQEPLLWFSWERIAEAGGAGLGWAGVYNVSRLWGMRTVPDGLGRGPGVIRGQRPGV